MVRTSVGIRISAGKSSKKGGGASSSGPSTPSSGKTSSRGSSRLPPIPHCEAPSWQKPITNFFNTGTSSSKDDPQITDQPEENLDTQTETEDKHNKGDSGTLVKKVDDDKVNAVKETNNSDGVERDKADTEKKTDLNNINGDEPRIKRRKEEQDKENEEINNA